MIDAHWECSRLGLFLLLLGGDSLVRGASGLAQRFGLSPFAAGLLLVSFATSVPGLAVNAYAFALGQSELALGNAIGSNIANIGLTLGLAALVAPLAGQHAPAGGSGRVRPGRLGHGADVGLDGTLGRWEGGGLLAGFLASWYSCSGARARKGPGAKAELAEFSVTSTGLVQNLIRLAFAGGCCYFGSRLVVDSAPSIGSRLALARC